jgi:hypothetical protein
LTDVVFIEETVDATIFLVESDEQGNWMTGLMGDGLKLLD